MQILICNMTFPMPADIVDVAKLLHAAVHWKTVQCFVSVLYSWYLQEVKNKMQKNAMHKL